MWWIWPEEAEIILMWVYMHIRAFADAVSWLGVCHIYRLRVQVRQSDYYCVQISVGFTSCVHMTELWYQDKWVPKSMSE